MKMVRQDKHNLNVGDCVYTPDPKMPYDTATVMITKVTKQSGKPTVYDVEDPEGNAFQVTEKEIRLRM